MAWKMEKDIDAVTVSTPDHTHAVASAMAMRMGKHCFTQKPLTHTLHEARVLVKGLLLAQALRPVPGAAVPLVDE